jgi:hypothetical protein
MEFRTVVDIADPGFRIEPCEQMLFVGSCFADSIGMRFREEGFPVTVNPYGTMYNPASIVHTIERLLARSEGASPSERTVSYSMAFLTLGTNHVYRLKETGEIVDNCQKRPAALFQEEELSVDACAACLMKAVTLLRQANPDIRIVLTVSPIRYRKYGYHGSQLSKATLLLAVDHLLAGRQAEETGQAGHSSNTGHASQMAYFPAYEIVLDELRDYRFYQPDMLHPSDQTVEYIWQQFIEAYFSPRAKQFLSEWKPIKEALGHRPFHPESDTYRQFIEKARQQEKDLLARYQNA